MNTNRSKLYEGKRSGDGSASGGGDESFNGQRAITRQTPGMQGYNPGTTTLIDFLEKVFYPPVGPACTLSVDHPIREIGQSTAFTLTWSVQKQSNPITGISVDGTAIAPTGADQNGTQAGNLPEPSGSYTKNMSVTDGMLTGMASCTVQYLARMFWGSIAKDGSSQPITDADILALPGNELRADFKKSFSDIGGGNLRLVFAWPSSFGTPQFTVNGLANTAFTKVRSASDFVNSQGATLQMDVWVSNYFYNSPLDNLSIN